MQGVAPIALVRTGDVEMVQESARAVALRAIPAWPGRDSLTAGRVARRAYGVSLSYRHGARVWIDCREAVAQHAGSLARGMPREQLRGVCEMAFVSALASHLDGCARCWAVGMSGGDRPVEWLTWCVARRPRLREILEPVLLDSGRSRRGLPAAPPVGTSA